MKVRTSQIARLSIVGFMFFSMTPAIAEDADMAMAKETGARYNECAYDSAISQIQPGSTLDINALAERAFASCTSEAEQISRFLMGKGATRDQVETAMLNKKTGIKRELRKMMQEIRSKE